jgi:hypothetical protein
MQTDVNGCSDLRPKMKASSTETFQMLYKRLISAPMMSSAPIMSSALMMSSVLLVGIALMISNALTMDGVHVSNTVSEK